MSAARYKRTRVHEQDTERQPRYTHRLIAAQQLGRALEPGEVVHHLDGDKTNNEAGNLVVLPDQGAHMSLEWFLRRYAGQEPLLEMDS
jgi:HNH endonuclease